MKYYRDADGLRAAMAKCKTWLAAKVLANEYRRHCVRYPSSLKDPLWLQVYEDITKMKRIRTARGVIYRKLRVD